MIHRHLLTICLYATIGLVAACAPVPEPDAVPTLAALPTASPTALPSPTLSAAPTATTAPTLTATATFTPSMTHTPSPSPTPTLTVTPSLTITDTPTATATDTPPPPPDNEAVSGLLALALQATVLPQATVDPARLAGGIPALSVSCAAAPPGGFGTVYTTDPALPPLLGCPNVATYGTIAAASQTFERGTMLYVGTAPPLIYVLSNDGRFQRFDDSYTAGVDPESGGEQPPAGLRAPVRGFGKVWRELPGVRAALGWALTDEAGALATVLAFDYGRMVYLPTRGDILILIDEAGGLTGNWRAAPGAP